MLLAAVCGCSFPLTADNHEPIIEAVRHNIGRTLPFWLKFSCLTNRRSEKVACRKCDKEVMNDAFLETFASARLASFLWL